MSTLFISDVVGKIYLVVLANNSLGTFIQMTRVDDLNCQENTSFISTFYE